MRRCLNNAFTEVHEQLCSNPDYDMRVSGSTLTAVILDDEYIYCANVGDSKAIIITDNKKEIEKKLDIIHQSNVIIISATHNPD